MSYVDQILRVRDADDETELLIERSPGDGAALRIDVTLGYGSPTTQRRGVIRLGDAQFHKLAAWLEEHAEDLRAVQRTMEYAEAEKREAREREREEAIATLIKLANRGAPEVEEAIALLERDDDDE